jgi:hypothetical protein
MPTGVVMALVSTRIPPVTYALQPVLGELLSTPAPVRVREGIDL